MLRGHHTVIPYLCRINVSIWESHWHVILVHYFAAHVANDSRVGMVTEGYLFSEDADVRIAHWTVDVVRAIIASG